MTFNSRPFYPDDEITSADLKEKWIEMLSFYDQMIDSGNPLRSIRFLVRHIIDKGYNIFYFPGSSLFKLFISIPIDSKVNYAKTLSVEVDELFNIVKFRYTDWTGLNRDDKADREKSLKWSETCQMTESCDTFEYFISTHPEWNPVNIKIN